MHLGAVRVHVCIMLAGVGSKATAASVRCEKQRQRNRHPDTSFVVRDCEKRGLFVNVDSTNRSIA